MKKLLFLLIIISIFGCNSNNKASTNEVSQEGYKIIAYVNEWQDNWGENFEKATQITHINYAFANIKNGRVIEGLYSDSETLKKLNALKKVNPHLKILISVGGWSWSGNFSDAVLTKNSRQVFANSAIDFMLKHEIDGVNLDWEYPGLIGAGNVNRPEDKENFTAILKLLRKKLDSLSAQNNKYLLTIATGASQNYLDHTNMKEAQKYVDFINIMTYDFHTGSEAKTGHHANFFSSKYDDNEESISAKIAVQQYIAAGIPANKIVLGVPFYGRWWKRVNTKNNGLFQPSTGVTGSYNYNSIADSLKTDKGFISYWDSTAAAPYIWRLKDSLFITYENPKSIGYKVNYVKENQLGGIMFWQFNGDNGTLLKTIFDNLNKTDQ
ncbi:MAG: glycoside hydrolase family 18 protein [Flavobacteriaceae bacterium]|nr:glycoside hydrolase family 18 protein [Flavobacteriaceae bacterium]